MVVEEKREYYNEIKEYNGQKYTGMRVGGKHSWNYNKGIWNEVKILPDKWKFNFTSTKHRSHQAPMGTGAFNNTKYHWYIIADQKVVKLDENSYMTKMNGVKYKVGHKMPNWKKWDYKYKNESYEDKIIKILQDSIKKLKDRKKKREILNYF